MFEKSLILLMDTRSEAESGHSNQLILSRFPPRRTPPDMYSGLKKTEKIAAKREDQLRVRSQLNRRHQQGYVTRETA